MVLLLATTLVKMRERDLPILFGRKKKTDSAGSEAHQPCSPGAIMTNSKEKGSPMSDKPKTPTEKAEEYANRTRAIVYEQIFYACGDNPELHARLESISSRFHAGCIDGFKAGHTEGRREALEMAQGLVELLKKIRKDRILLRSPRAGGQDQYAGLPGAMRLIDMALAKFEEWKDGK